MVRKKYENWVWKICKNPGILCSRYSNMCNNRNTNCLKLCIRGLKKRKYIKIWQLKNCFFVAVDVQKRDATAAGQAGILAIRKY